MLTGVEQVKNSATWGGAKSAPTPTDSKTAGSQPSRKQTGAKRAAQFLLCFGLMLMLSMPASARNISKHVSPELYTLIQNGDPSQTVDVIVQYKKKFAKQHLDNATKRGAKMKRQFDLVQGAQFTLTLDQVSDLADDTDVKYVTLNRKVKMSVDDVTAAVSADIAWSYGFDGTGVGVAVIDSGVYAHSDLNQGTTSTSRVVYSESFVPGDTTTSDAYGHGTHVAGIVGGNGLASQTGYKAGYQGVAPNANIINLRVLDANGCGSDGAVIAAIQRAIQLKSQYNIRVINLSLGRSVYESFTLDPLDQAVEQAWKNGIVVVVAAGNSGRDDSKHTGGYGTIGAPGNDPYVITVGATVTNGTNSSADDKIATYSSKGPTLLDHVVKPDLVAPGDKVVSLRDPSGTLVTANPTMNVYPCAGTTCTAAQGTPKYFKLSGTSMATPVVAGAVALMFQKDPTLTPDVIKARLMKSANKTLPMLSVAADTFGRKYNMQYDLFTYGAGYLNIAAALNNNDSSSGVALSPRVVYSSGLVYLDPKWNASGQSVMWGNSVLWGSSVLWGNSVLWGDSVIWGTSALKGTGGLGGLLNSNSVLWGDSVIWGNSTNQGFSVLWGNSVLWGDSMSAFSDGDPGDCNVDDSGNVVCSQ